MTFPRKTLITTACAALSLFGTSLVFGAPAQAATAVREGRGIIRYFDDRGFDRGYAWCLRRSGYNWAGSFDCNYFTLAQCRASMAGPGGECTPNPWAQFVVEPPQRRHRR